MRVHIAFVCTKAPLPVKSEVMAKMDHSADGSDEESDSQSDSTPSAMKKPKVDAQGSQSKLSRFVAVGRVSKERKIQLDRELTKFLIGCNIPFRVVDSPFFKRFISVLQPGYQTPSASTVGETLLWEEAAIFNRNMLKEIQQDSNLTLTLDGWTDNGMSLYAFVVLTSDRRVYLHSLKNFSAERHTAAFLTEETVKILEEIGSERVAAIVTDNAANMRKLRQNISEKYPAIFDLRCMPHYINLITQDIVNHSWAKEVVKSSMAIVNYFNNHTRQNTMLAKCRSDDVPSLKGYVKTRWFTCGNCIKSILLNEDALLKVVKSAECDITADIRSIVLNRQYWADCETLFKVLSPLMTVIGQLESKNATIADCYHQLLSLAAVINENLSGPDDFRHHCSAMFARRWTDLNDEIHMLAFFLHPAMHGKGICSSVFPKIAQTAASMWKSQGYSKTSTMRLITQLMKFKNGEKPYDLPFAKDFMTPTLWWTTMEDAVGSELKTIAIKLLSITPHSAACERTFSVLGWIHSKARNRLQVEKLEAIGKIYMYNSSHRQTEMPRGKSQDANTSTNCDDEVNADEEFDYCADEDRDSNDSSQLQVCLKVMLAPLC